MANASRSYKDVAGTRDVRQLKGLVAKPDKAVSVKAMNRAVAKSVFRRK